MSLSSLSLALRSCGSSRSSLDQAAGGAICAIWTSAWASTRTSSSLVALRPAARTFSASSSLFWILYMSASSR